RLLSFFFQAEDGIRDRNVTGVQTCALPIYSKNSKTMEWSPGMAGRLAKRRDGQHRAVALRRLVAQMEALGAKHRRLVARLAHREIGRASCRERGDGEGDAGRRTRAEVREEG